MYGLDKTIQKVKENNLSVRKSDILALIATLSGGIMLTLSIFVFSSLVINILDTMILIDLCYTWFLAYVSGSSLSGWPVVCLSNHLNNGTHRISND